MSGKKDLDMRSKLLMRRFLKVAGICLALLGMATVPGRAQSASDPVYVFHTSLGNISVQLYPDVAPQTVANFLRYVNSGAYNNSLFHRSVPGFVIQGGGFTAQSSAANPSIPNFTAIPTNAPVVNEFHVSNTRGTIAMAKLDPKEMGGGPNSATDQWFFNEGDNSGNLDAQNGGFTVFGKVADAASLAVMDKLAALPTYNYSSANAAFNQIPLLNYQSGAVQLSNLVFVSSITPAAGAHILWNNANGSASIWSYETGGGTYSHAEYGPFAGYTAKAVADGGTDGKTRVLWTKTDGSVSLWSLDNLNAVYTHAEFGPFSGYTAAALSVGGDSTTHLLWTNTNGSVSIWNYSSAAGTYTHREYGPFAGYTAKAIAGGGTDDKVRVLWGKTDGSVSIWSLDNAAGTYTHSEFGPYPGWTANALSVSSTTHILWNNSSGALSLWNYSPSYGSFTQITYGPYPGWTAVGVGDGPDGKTRVQWNNRDGRLSVWSLDNALGTYSQFSFGPYPGWTAASLAAGS